MKLDLIGGSVAEGRHIVRDLAGSEGGSGGGSQHHGRRKLLDHTRAGSLEERLPRTKERGKYVCKDLFGDRLSSIGTKTYYFPTINQDIFRKIIVALKLGTR